MSERRDARRVVGAYATAEKEGRVTVVGVKNTPIELQSVASRLLGFGVEKEIVGDADIVIGRGEVSGSGDVEGLDDGYG